MKALMGELAKKIRKDENGSEALSSFLTASDADSQIITLSDGSRYKVSRKRPSTNGNKQAIA